MSGSSFTCPRCGTPLGAPEQRAGGQRFECRQCRLSFVLQPPQKTKSETESQTGSSADATPVGPSTGMVPLPPGWIPLDPFGPSTSGERAKSDAGAAKATRPTARPAAAFDPLSERPGATPGSGVTPGAEFESVAAAMLRRRKRSYRSWLIPASVCGGILCVGLLFLWDRLAHRNIPADVNGSTPVVIAKVPRAAQAQSADGQRIPQPASKSGGGAPSSQAQAKSPSATPAGRKPIRLLLAPDGVRIIVHLRPAELWSAKGHPAPATPPKATVPLDREAELRECLAPLADWAEQEIGDWCLFPPAEIREVLFSFVLRTPGEPPDVAATVWLAEPTSTAEIAKRFGGEPVEKAPLPTYTKGDRALVIRDARTFAIGPQSAAQEMAEGNGEANPTDASIEELLKETDRRRQLTVVFRPDDLDRFRETLFPAPLVGVAHRVAQWLDPDAIEGVAIGVRLADPLRLWLALRNRSGTGVRHLEEDVQKRLEHLPLDVLAHVRRLRPETSGHRKLIGRVPAMWKAVALGSESSTEARLVSFESVLPERAAANLALGTYLTLMEPPGPSTSPEKSSGAAEKPQSIAERLQMKIDVDFRRTPLSEAFTSIGEEMGVPFEIDGGALKLSGYTKNMPQTFRLNQASASEALKTILKPYPKMALVVDEEKKRITVTTLEAAKEKGLKTFSPAK